MVSRSSGQSLFLVVVISRRGRHGLLLWLVVLYGQSSRLSWSVMVVTRSSWMVFIFCGGYAHVSTETFGWENRGQCLDKCTGVGRTRVGGHETRPKLKPNVDYYLFSYLLLLLLLLLLNVY